MASRAVAVRTRTRTVVVRRRARGRSKMTIPLAVVVGLLPTVAGVWSRKTSAQEMARFLSWSWTGYDPVQHIWNTSQMGSGLFPAVGGFAVHFLANKLGVNRAIRRVVPFISI